MKYFLVSYKVKESFEWSQPNPMIVVADSSHRAKLQVEWEREISEVTEVREIDIDSLTQHLKPEKCGQWYEVTNAFQRPLYAECALDEGHDGVHEGTVPFAKGGKIS